MKWKKYIEDQHLKGRIPQEWKAKIVSTAETAIEGYKIELLKQINILLEKSKLNKDSISEKCINTYSARLDTFEEIIKLIIK